MHTLDERRWYLKVYRAVRRKDSEELLRLIREYPQFRSFVGQAGDVVELIAREAPELLEPAFEVGLSPDCSASRDPFPQTLLQSAAADGDLLRLRLLLRYGANPERRNDWGEVALGYACSYGQLEAVRALVEAGAEVNVIEHNPETGYRATPLDAAGQYPEIVQYLRDRGAKTLEELGRG